MKKFLVGFLTVCTLFTAGCHDRVEYVQAPVPVVADAPVYVANSDPMTGVITGMVIGSLMSNNMRYDGHNGYYDSRYHGPPRTIVQNVTNINNNSVPKNVNTPIHPTANSVSAPVASVANSIVAPVKSKSPGDAAAEAEKAKMKAEADAKSAQQAKQAQLKADLQTKQAARAASKSSGGFNSMSKSASSMSFRSKSSKRR